MYGFHLSLIENYHCNIVQLLVCVRVCRTIFSMQRIISLRNGIERQNCARFIGMYTMVLATKPKMHACKSS